MRKFFVTLLTLLMAVALVGCGGSKDDKKSETESSKASTTETSNEFVFTYKDVTIAMNQDTSEFLEKLGDSRDYFEAKSCAFEGLDKTYDYAGFRLTTYPTDDVDYVNSIVLNDDTVSTTEGVCIGDSKDKVIETYGKDYKEEGVGYVYTKGKSQLQFIFEDDVITNISYVAITPAD